LSTHTHDDAFREIQLNGKQLVFLFMAATVVSVVIFLCGVLVGRGVRAERAAAGESPGGEASVTELSPQRAAPAPQTASTPAGSDPTAAAPPPAVEDLSYFKRLEKPGESAETLKATRQPPAKPEAAAEQPPPAQARSTKPAAAVAARESGFAVQVAALNVRTEAEAIANRLASKGYAAYVMTPLNGTPAVFRVRVGRFGTRREAETIAAKLQREEQFKPWITR
jgi:cell division septation protein DedD